MRKPMLFLGLAVLALLSPARADNILACPGFETTADSGWWYHHAADSIGTIAILDSSAAHTGSFGVKAVIKQTSANYWDVQLGIPRNWVANLGSTYSMTFWAKADSQRTLLVNTLKKHGYSDLGNSLNANLDTNWQQFTVPSFVIADTSDTGNGTNGVQVSINFGDVVGTFYFDDFDLEETPDTSSSDAIRLRALGSTPVRASLHGREISFSGPSGTTVRLLDLRGHVASSALLVNDRAGLRAPGSGLWIVEAGKVRVSVAVP